MSRLRSVRTATAVVVALLTLVVVALSTIEAPLTPHVDRAPGADRALQGGAELRQAELKPGVDNGKSKPVTLTNPKHVKLAAAKSAIFDVRNLKSHVVKTELPEVEYGYSDEDAAASDPGGSVPQTLDGAQTTTPNAGSAPAPTPTTTFAGLAYVPWGAGHPPDTNGDVGPTYYIQTINSSIGIFNKSTGSRVAAFTLDALMSQGSFGNLCDTDNFGDPVVLYDSFEDRWVVSDFAFQLDASGNVSPQHVYQCIAVSKSGDPVNGGWNFYWIENAGGLSDYPKFGVWPDGIYMSANVFGYGATSSYITPRVWAFNKLEMYDDAPSVDVVSFDPPAAEFTLLPANARLQTGTPPTGSPNYFAVVWQYLNSIGVYKFHVDWNSISASTFSGPFTSTDTFWWSQFSGASGRAPTPANANDTLYPRLMMQNQYTNIGGVESIWDTHTVGAGNPTTNVSSAQAAVRYYQVNVTGGTVAASTRQSYTYSPDATLHRYMPSIAVDRAGDMAMGYTTSNSTTNPALAYAGSLAGDSINSITQSEQLMFQGTGAQSGTCGTTACSRWGDYSAMTLDPDGCTFWYTNEYYATSGLNYQTRIGSFKYPSCTPVVAGGTIAGTVTASSGGAAIAGATVSLGSRSTTTAADGTYSFSSLPPGVYPGMTVSAPGFGGASAASIAVVQGGTTTRNFALSAAAQAGSFTDTTKADFESGIPANVSLVTSPGNVVLANPDAIDQKNATVSPTGFSITSTSWAGQTFTPAVTGKVKRVDVELFCSGCTAASPNITLSIRATTGTTPVPTGSDLASATLPGFNDGGAGGLKTFTLASPVTLTAGVRYAFVFRLAGAISSGVMAYTCSCLTSGYSNSSPYSAGQRVMSTNSGSSWTADTKTGGRDLSFQVWMNTGYVTTGTFVSSLKDANPAANGASKWANLSWTATTPANTSVTFQAAASDSKYGPFNFVGPDGTSATTFSNGASLSQFNGKRYLRYRATLSTTDRTTTPALNAVTIGYSDGAPASLNVNPASGSFGGSANLAAALSSNGSPVPGKSLSFTLNGNPAGSAVTDANGVATVTGASLAGIPAGSYPTGVSVSWAGDSSYGGAAGSAVLTVGRANASVQLSNLSQAYDGSPKSVSVTTTPIGLSVDVTYDGSTSAPTDVGSYAVVATINDANYQGSASGTLAIAKAATTTAVTTSPSSSVFSQPVTFTAAVSSAVGTPGGTIQFKVDGNLFGVPVALDSSGHATSATASRLGVKKHTIAAVYSGDATHAASTGKTTETVSKASVTVWVTSSANPAVHGAQIVFKIHVASVAPATAVPGGSVQLFVNGTQLGLTESLSSGVAKFTVTWTMGAGTFNISGKYLGTAKFLPASSAVLQQVIT